MLEGSRCSKAPVKAASKKKPSKIYTGEDYSEADLKRFKAARLKYVGTPKYFMSDEYKKKVLAGRKKPAGDEVTDFLRRRPLAKTKKTIIAAKKKAVVKKKSAVKKPDLTPKT